MTKMEGHGCAASEIKAKDGSGWREPPQAGDLLIGQHLGMDHDAALPSQMRRSGVASQAFTLSSGRPITVSQKRS